MRVEDRYDTDIDDLWSALTDPDRLARWLGQVEGDLRPGGEFRMYVEASDIESTGRVEACEPPRRLLVTTRETDESYRKGQGVPPFDKTVEATLTADGDQTILVLEVRGMPLDKIAFYGAGGRSTPRTSPPMSPDVSPATPRRVGKNSSLPIRSWRPTSAEPTSGRPCRVPTATTRRRDARFLCWLGRNEASPIHMLLVL